MVLLFRIEANNVISEMITENDYDVLNTVNENRYDVTSRLVHQLEHMISHDTYMSLYVLELIMYLSIE